MSSPRGAGAKWKKACATANFIVKYTKKDTDNVLNGEEGCELSAGKYGVDEWWLLLEPAASS